MLKEEMKPSRSRVHPTMGVTTIPDADITLKASAKLSAWSLSICFRMSGAFCTGCNWRQGSQAWVSKVYQHASRMRQASRMNSYKPPNAKNAPARRT